MIDDQELQKLRDLSIEGVAERLGITIRHRRFCCPAHDDHTPSASVSKSGTRWKCWSCGAGGNAIDLTMSVLNKSFKEAAEWLANGSLSLTLPQREGTGSRQKPAASTFDPSRYERFFVRPWLSPDASHFLYVQRRLDPRVVRWCRITSWHDRNGVSWLQTPYYDVEGKLIGVQNRNLGPSRPPLKGGDQPGEKSPFKGDLEGLPRFRFPYGSRCSIYNLPVLKMLRPGEELYITEGCSDCWAMLSDGHKALAIPSATLLSPKDKELLVRVGNELSIRWKMAPDQDEPGRRLAAQLKEILPTLQLYDLPDGCKDYSDFYLLKKAQKATDNPPELTLVT